MLQIADLVAGKWLKGIGGASRDRTDDLIVANDGILHSAPMTTRLKTAHHGPIPGSAGSCLRAFPFDS
jgi:hypothetical protein